MDWQVLELFAFFVSYLLVGLGFLWAFVGEPLLRIRADFKALRAEHSARLDDFRIAIKSHVPPFDV